VLDSEKRKEVISNFQLHPMDTGSPEVQIALLSARIEYLTETFQVPQEGSPLSQRSFETGRAAKRTSGLS